MRRFSLLMVLALSLAGGAAEANSRRRTATMVSTLTW